MSYVSTEIHESVLLHHLYNFPSSLSHCHCAQIFTDKFYIGQEPSVQFPWQQL